MVLYRKYRPQTLDELVGQTSAVQALKSALSAEKLAHAYLFCGPRGTGKTSMARILAKIVNCESKEKNLPCNKCSSCLSITEGSSLDVIEMDAASNRGIDDIRALRENIKLAPSGAKKKVYIIDEVHMLSTEAFNALLKTLEEPPSHVLFILATTEAHKIPQTILSRVSKLEFKEASIEEAIKALKQVAETEKIKISDDALRILAKKAQGSFRDAIKFLDILSGLDKIDASDIETNLGVGSFENINNLLGSLAKKDGSTSLQELTRIVSAGSNIKELSLSILDTLRQLLFIKYELGQELVQPETGPEKFGILVNLTGQFSKDQLIFTIDVFQKSLEMAKYVSIPTLPLEMAVVEVCNGGHIVLPVVSENITEIVVEKTVVKSEKEDAIEISTDNSPDLQKIADRWTYVLETIRAYNCSLEALLRSSKMKDCTTAQVIIEVPYPFHQRIIEAPKSKDMLESIFSDILGRSIAITTVLGHRPVPLEELNNIEVAKDDEIVRLAAEIFNSEPN